MQKLLEAASGTPFFRAQRWLLLLATIGALAVGGEALATGDPPIAEDDDYATGEDTLLTVPAADGVLDNDTDAELDALIAVLIDDVANGTLVLSADGSFTYDPDLNFNGSDTFTYQANDGETSGNTATVTITVSADNDAPTAVADSYSTAEDTTLNIAAPGVLGNDTDVEGDGLTAVLISDAASGTLTLNANGSFTYTPDPNFSGTDSFTYQADDGPASSNTATVTITVTADNDAPTAVADSYSTAEDTTLIVAAPGVLGNDTDPEGDGLTAVLISDAASGTLTLNANGSFTYTPDPNFSGTDSFTYQADDGPASSNTATVTITVTAENDAPTAVANSYSTPEDTTLNVAAPGVLGNDTDPEGDGLTAVLISDAASGTLTLNANGSFTYTPDPNFSGTDSFTYQADDGPASSNTATVTITVTAENDAPTAVANSYNIAEDTTLNIAAPGVLGNDTDPEGDVLTAVLNTTTSSGTLTLNATGSFSYIPNANFNGADSFTYHASDGTLSSNIVTVSITVMAGNDAPTAVANSYNIAEDTTLIVAAPGVLGNDTDPDTGTTLTAVLNTTATSGTLALNANGSFSYAPNANFNGADSFTYHASDGSLSSNIVTVSITVTASNDAPTAVANSYNIAEDTTLNIAAPGVLGNDTDPEGDVLTAVLNTTTSSGTLTLNPNGSFSYAPNANFNGADSFTYHASDGTLSSNIVTVSITVMAGNDAPTAVANSYSTPEDTTLNVAAPGVLGNDTDPDTGTTLTAVLNTTAASGTLTLNANGSFSYAPNTNFNGADSFTYHASDGSLSSNIVTVSITVTASNDAPTAVANSYNTAEDTTLNIAAPGVLGNDTDPDTGTTLTAVLNTNVSNGALTLNPNGSFSYAPNANFNGADSFTYHASDGSLSSNIVTVSITVTASNDAPTAVANSYNTAEDTPLIVAAPGVLGNDTDPDTGTILTAVLNTTTSSGTLTLNATGSFAYAPNANFNGADSFTYHASDGSLSSNIVTVNITVTAGNDAPTAVANSYNTAEDTTLNIAAPGVLVNDTDPDTGTILTAVLDTTTSSGTLTLNATGSFSYVPNADFNGADSFTYHANDGTLSSNVVTVSITVTADNDAPTAVADSYSTAEDTTLNVAAPGVLVNDTDPDSDTTLTAVLDTNVSNGTLTLNATGSFSYVPNADFNGADSFTYHANDGSLSSNIVTVNITVTADNDAPTAVADSYSTAEDTPLSVAAPGVLGNDTDPEVGTILTAVLDTNVSSGTLALNANGSFSYSPNVDFSGADSFTYHANDGSLSSNIVIVTITVTGVNDPPFVTSSPPAAVAEDVTYSYTITASDPDGDPLTFAAATLPAWLTFDGTDTISGTPTQDDIGPHDVTMTVSDGIAPAVQQSFTIRVDSVDDRPEIAPIADQTATELVAFSLNLGDFVSDVDTQPSGLSYAATTPLPSGLTLSTTGILFGTPALDDSVGDFSVGFQVSDGPNTSDASFHLTVLRAGRADLAVTVGAAPNPVALNATATWTFTITNNAPQVDVGSYLLEAVFAGEVPFQFATPTNGCTIAPSGIETRVSCTLGPLAGGATTAVTLSGSGSFAGDVFATATVSIVGPVPIDETPRNDTASGSLSVAQGMSTTPAQLISGFDARAAAAGDLNGDGFIDLAIATGSSQRTLVFLNVVDPGNPNKRVLSDAPVALDGQASDNGIVLADLDGDSDLDVVTATGAGAENRIFLNSGSATFTALTLGDASEDSRAVAAGDINGDLLTDLVFANGSPNTVYTNQGSAGVFAQTASLGNADSRGVVLVDLFGDALPELVFANADGDATVYRNAAGTFQLELTLPTGPTTSVAAADFNNDGRSDLVFGRSAGATPTVAPSNLVWLNTSATTGSFFLADELGASPTTAVVVADIDLDGDPDILAINATGGHQVYRNIAAASGAFVLHPQQMANAGALTAAVGRFSIDARVDAALVGPNGAAVFYNDGSGNLGSGDVTAPTIQLRGESSVTMIVESTYTDAGATATDTVDGDITARVVVTNPVNAAVIGTYTVTYNATDLSGNSAAPVTRTVQVQARQGTGGGGGGAIGLEFAVLLAFVTVLSRLRPKWRLRSIVVTRKQLALWAALTMPPLTASASELAYTFLDFQRPKSTIDATGVQTPVPGQTVEINALDGDGIAVGGSLAVGERFYVGGSYKSSIIGVTGVISNPLVTVSVADTFDLIQTNLAFGYKHEIGDELDLVAEISYDSANYDFGSFAGENFDLDDSGVGGRVGLRWNPTLPVELYLFGRYSPVAKAALSERTYEKGTSVSAGVRWYFFENLGVGIEYDSGDIDTTTISMRFSFGNLPW